MEHEYRKHIGQSRYSSSTFLKVCIVLTPSTRRCGSIFRANVIARVILKNPQLDNKVSKVCMDRGSRWPSCLTNLVHSNRCYAAELFFACKPLHASPWHVLSSRVNSDKRQDCRLKQWAFKSSRKQPSAHSELDMMLTSCYKYQHIPCAEPFQLATTKSTMLTVYISQSYLPWTPPLVSPL